MVAFQVASDQLSPVYGERAQSVATWNLNDMQRLSAVAWMKIKEGDSSTAAISFSQNNNIHILCAIVFENLILYSRKIALIGKVFICNSHL